MTSLADPEHHFKFGNLIRTQFFDKNDCFHHLSEQISTFIHRKANLTLGKHGSLAVIFIYNTLKMTIYNTLHYITSQCMFYRRYESDLDQ